MSCIKSPWGYFQAEIAKRDGRVEKKVKKRVSYGSKKRKGKKESMKKRKELNIGRDKR